MFLVGLERLMQNENGLARLERGHSSDCAGIRHQFRMRARAPVVRPKLRHHQNWNCPFMTLVSLKRRALYHTPIPRRNTFFETLFFSSLYRPFASPSAAGSHSVGKAFAPWAVAAGKRGAPVVFSKCHIGRWMNCACRVSIPHTHGALPRCIRSLPSVTCSCLP